MDLPGGPHFSDVTQIFADASEEMIHEELLMANGFTLSEAMSAVEIGDPRMDSGAITASEAQQPAFDPLTPLLPGEVCWILDRTVACEMQWHVGNALAQTMYTCLYMHYLPMINPDFLKYRSIAKTFDKQRPLELISLVIRSGVLGVVKCCDLVYRELVKGNVHDGEDWQGEKSDVSLHEGVPTQKVISILEEAEVWLTSDDIYDLPYRVDLLHRLQLRKVLLQLYEINPQRNAILIAPYVAEVRRLLGWIRSHPITPPRPDSPARFAFDARVTRHLHTAVPLRALMLPSQEDTWDIIVGLLDGWLILSRLATCTSLLAWDAESNMRACSPKWSSVRLPYLRSLAQSIFSDGTTVLGDLSHLWLMDHFFLEIAHISFNHLHSLLEIACVGSLAAVVEEFQRSLTKLLLQHIWAPYHNRPRHRRHLMKANVEWHALYEGSVIVSGKIHPRDNSDVRILKCLPLAILHWRICVVRDLILSGFELELYAVDEHPFAYWYLSQILVVHESTLRDLLDLVTDGSTSYQYLSFQLGCSMAIKELSMVCFLVLCSLPKFNTVRRYQNFSVRYKWALHETFKSIAAPDPLLPNYGAYLLQEKNVISGSQTFMTAIDLCCLSLRRLERLKSLASSEASLQLCFEDYLQTHLAGMVTSCESLKTYLESTNAKRLSVDLSRFTWNPAICPWFPQVQ